MDRTDEQLAVASIEGDRQAFGALVERLRAGLIGYITGLLGTRDDAEELAQEAFLVAWQKIHGLREPARVGGWIGRIAHNLTVRRAKVVQTVPLGEDPPADRANPSDKSNPGEDPRLVGLLAAVARLGRPHREVIARKHFDGHTGEQIARDLGVKPGTVRSRLSRAYGELREMLTEQEDD